MTDPDPDTPQAPSSGQTQVFDLRSALAVLERIPGQLLTTSEPVDPYLEMAGVYKLAGAGTPLKPPTRLGPAMLFENVKGFPGVRLAAGVLASRERTARLLGTSVDRLPFTLLAAIEHAEPPVNVSREEAPCQEVVHKSPVDINRLLPVPTFTAEDAGPFLSLGLVWAEDPETGESDVTIHRMCVHGPDLLSIYFVPGRHIDAFRCKAEKAGRALPVSINIGVDPAILLSACFEPPTTPLGFNELTIAGGLRHRPVGLVDCLTVAAKAIAHAEIVIEGEVLPGRRVREDARTGLGFAMPEFPGYQGKSQPEVPVIRIKAITHRRNPIFQTLVGPAEEHTSLTGVPTEASILRLAEAGMPGVVKNVYCHPAGGGKYLAIIQVRKSSPSDEGRQRQAALIAFASFSELKHVFLVDEDVDLFDSNDVLWAMTTRYQGDASTVFIPGVRCHPLDPSQSPEFSPTIREQGVTCKTIFDCTVPFRLRERFRRPEFAAVDLERFLKGKP